MEQHIQELWNSNKRYNRHRMGLSEEKEWEEKNKPEDTFEVIMVQNFPKLITGSKP